jgi:hypothetical protein
MARGSSSSPKWKGLDPEHFRGQDGPHVAGVQDLHRNPDHESVRRIVVRWHIQLSSKFRALLQDSVVEISTEATRNPHQR